MTVMENNDNNSSSSSVEEDKKDLKNSSTTTNRRRKVETQQRQQEMKTSNNKKSKIGMTPLQVAPVIQQDQDSAINKSILATKYSSGQVCTQPIVILLDQATLETIKNNRHSAHSNSNNAYELLNCDDHREICKKKLKVDPNNYRPDIVHQILLSIIDSPINKYGLLKIYIKTTKNILIDINPLIRIPRTYKRFAGLMVQLLHTMKIKSTTSNGDNSSSTTLLRIIKNPFQQYLLPNTIIYGLECSGTLYSPISFVQSKLSSTIPLINIQQQSQSSSANGNGNQPICFIIGAMSNGNITFNDHPYIQEMIKLSEYPLSGAAATSRLLGAIEYHWGIV